MNKFVKGAKNLALALSFVSVCACNRGGEKENSNGVSEEIKDLENRLSKIEGKATKKVEGGKVEIDFYSKSEVDGLITASEDKLKKEVVMRGDCEKLFMVEDDFGFENLKKVKADFSKRKCIIKKNKEGSKIEVVVDDIVACEDFGNSFKDLKILINIIGLGGNIVCQLEEGDKVKIVAGSNANKINWYDNFVDTVASYGTLGKDLFEKIYDRNLTEITKTNKEVGSQDVKGTWSRIKNDEVLKGALKKGLEILFNEKGGFAVGVQDEKGLNQLDKGKNGFVFDKKVGSTLCCIEFE